jgi:ubiquinone/menaquinone biosynthesis C-methylase UbiE
MSKGGRLFNQNPPDTGWDKVSGWYDNLVGDKGSDYHQNIILPGSLKLLSPKSGEKILDAACGQGIFCRKLAELGAEVTGIDSSPNLIRLAKKHSSHKQNIEYYICKAEDLSILKGKIFDAATCIMAIQNIEYFREAIKQIYCVLKNGGRFLIVMNHPCFRIPRQSGWGYDEKRKLQFRRIDSYLSEQIIPIQMRPGKNPHLFTWTFHRPLSSYFEALAQNSFNVAKLEEWSSHRKSKPGAKQRTEDRARLEIPLFLAILAIKRD